MLANGISPSFYFCICGFARCIKSICYLHLLMLYFSGGESAVSDYHYKDHTVALVGPDKQKKKFGRLSRRWKVGAIVLKRSRRMSQCFGATIEAKAQCCRVSFLCVLLSAALQPVFV